MAADVALAPGVDESVRVLAQPSPLAFWATFLENRGAVFGLIVVAAIVAAAIAADFIARILRSSSFVTPCARRRSDPRGSWRFRSAPTATATTCCRG